MTRDVPGPEQFRRWGIDPAWSRHVDVVDAAGVSARWHVLERSPADPELTIVCVHGNPTWSALWVSFLDRLGDRHRVIAPDLLGMGYSDRTDSPRSFTERVSDLDHLLDALDVDGPVVLAAHDWGGAIAMGWAVDHPGRVAAMVLANTGIAVPEGRAAPAVIRLAATRGVHDLATRRTPLFVRGTGWLSRRRLGGIDRAMLAAPYRSGGRRTAIGDFVADIPFTPEHPSAPAISSVAERLGELDVPVLLIWGGRDPVFDLDFAADLRRRLRRADLHRIADAGHLVIAESATDRLRGPSAADVADAWLASAVHPPSDTTPSVTTPSVTTPAGPEPAAFRPAWAAIDERRDDVAIAFHDGAADRSIPFDELHRMLHRIGGGLAERGVQRGHRVALLVPPSPELVALVYACWRIGAVTVIADRGLGLDGLGRAVRGAQVDAVIGPRPALAAARTLRWAPSARTIGLDAIIAMTAARGAPASLPDPPPPDDLAAVLYTSGATGPAKGVRYTHRRLASQRDALRDRYDIGPDDRFVAAFAPFALYGPALGITSAVPDVDVTRPGELTAEVLDRACAAIDATMVFASPAALANVVRTAHGPLPALARVRTVMSAGAPVPVRTLRAVSALAPAASLYTPYGMTEVLPVADIELAEIELALSGGGGGVCVGRPVGGCDVTIAPLGLDPDVPLQSLATGETGEVMVRAPWMSAGYDGLWHTERQARPVDHEGVEWHRSGDVGHLDHDGRLWIEGRAVHVVHHLDGPLTPVPIEVAVESVDGVDRAAAVGVGPEGIQQLVVVVEREGPPGRGRTPRRLTRAGIELADLELTARIRAAVAPVPVAAVCVCTELPVDIRHNAKIDRAEVARMAARFLAGSGAPT